MWFIKTGIVLSELGPRWVFQAVEGELGQLPEAEPSSMEFYGSLLSPEVRTLIEG